MPQAALGMPNNKDNRPAKTAIYIQIVLTWLWFLCPTASIFVFCCFGIICILFFSALEGGQKFNGQICLIKW